jgi:hypothetical protein
MIYNKVYDLITQTHFLYDPLRDPTEKDINDAVDLILNYADTGDHDYINKLQNDIIRGRKVHLFVEPVVEIVDSLNLDKRI